MLIEKEASQFIKTKFKEEVLRQLPAEYDGSACMLTLALKLDLSRILRKNNEVAMFIIGNYPSFIKITELTLLQILAEDCSSIPQYGINVSLQFQNCPLPRYNIESTDFLHSAFSHKQGVIIYLKNAHVLSISQPELYLLAWQEIWVPVCNCTTSTRKNISRRQSLIDLIKRPDQNLKDVGSELVRCDECQSKMKNLGRQQEVYLNCQKVKLLSNMKSKECLKEEIFHTGIIELYLDESNINRLKSGDIIDSCCYFFAEPKTTRQGGQFYLQTSLALYLICLYPSSGISSVNNTFFSNASRLTLESIYCSHAKDYETIIQNYDNLIKSVNYIRFPYLQSNSLTSLKISAILSLFGQQIHHKIHLLVLTDEVRMIEKALEVSHISLFRWPSQYDLTSLLAFLTSCHNSVLLIRNPNNKDLQHVKRLLTGSLLPGLNVIVWIVSQPNPDLKKELDLELIGIVLDLSIQKNANVCASAFEDQIDTKLNAFVKDQPDQIPPTVPANQRNRAKNLNKTPSQSSRQSLTPNQTQIERQNEIAKDLLQRYYLRARQYKNISSSTLENIRKVSETLSYFRRFVQHKGKCSQQAKLNVLDAVLAIFFEQQSSRNRHKACNTLFANQVSKLLLNEQNCQLSFWQYEQDENEDIGQLKKSLPKRVMFERVLSKLMMLLYDKQFVD